MPTAINSEPENHAPAMGDAIIFRCKATLLQIKRSARNILSHEVERFPAHAATANQRIIAESVTPLWTEDKRAELSLVAGKVHNLRLALRRLNDVEVPAGCVFSFWKQIGRARKWKGYVAGRELREGCIIPTIGGGLCQLSNALYDTALRAGFEIVERHAHTQVIPGSLAEAGRDATVFWNYVDLRFKSRHAFRIEALMDADSLIVRFKGDAGGDFLRKHRAPVRDSINLNSDGPSSDGPQSCLSCRVQDCFRHVENGNSPIDFGCAAYLVDEFWPEFDCYIDEARHERDLLCLPLDGKRWSKANYAWKTEGFGQVKQEQLFTLLRAYRSRRLAMQGAARQRELLAAQARLARNYVAHLSFDVTHVTLTQSLLPYLWRDGALGGRTFDVLMTALPLARLHERLDAAFRLHPESNTLADFRADDWLVEAESEALQNARRIITPHTEIAALFPEQSMLVHWAIPTSRTPVQSSAVNQPRLVFPAPTVGRKGAYELRAALKELDVRLMLMGAHLEGKNFWQGIAVEQYRREENWLDGAVAVVLPAFVEHKPRRLLEAIAHGVPVIASTACGLENIRGVVNIPPGDAEALRTAIENLLLQKSDTPSIQTKELHLI
ncbi:MAG TPA: VanW family protein [Pyrinomonadaceae bacterium]|jgi:hypothetical protein